MARRPATNPPARLNRGLLALVALLLLAAAVLAAGTGTGRLPLTSAGDRVLALPGPLPSWWGWPAAAIGVVVGLAGLRWLLAQARRRPAGVPWTVDAAGPTTGTTTVPSPVLAAALRDDLTAQPGVADAHARLLAGGPVPALFLELALDARADPAAVRVHLEQHALPRLRAALGVDALDTRLLLRTGRDGEDHRVA